MWIHECKESSRTPTLHHVGVTSAWSDSSTSNLVPKERRSEEEWGGRLPIYPSATKPKSGVEPNLSQTSRSGPKPTFWQTNRQRPLQQRMRGHSIYLPSAHCSIVLLFASLHSIRSFDAIVWCDQRPPTIYPPFTLSIGFLEHWISRHRDSPPITAWRCYKHPMFH